MKKIHILLSCLMTLSFYSSQSQTYDTTSYYGHVNYLFDKIDKSQITKGLLREYGIDFLNPDNYTGAVLHDSNWINLDDWR